MIKKIINTKRFGKWVLEDDGYRIYARLLDKGEVELELDADQIEYGIHIFEYKQCDYPGLASDIVSTLLSHLETKGEDK